jgi:predicted lactoylglutathione lyase
VEQRVSLLTLGVADYSRAKAFYEALGWSVTLDIEETAFFQTSGCVVVLWSRDKLAEDTGIPDDGPRWGGILLAHNVRSRDKVDKVIEQARSNGAEITREPSETFYGGYAGAFRDLDGHPGKSPTIRALTSTMRAASSFRTPRSLQPPRLDHDSAAGIRAKQARPERTRARLRNAAGNRRNPEIRWGPVARAGPLDSEPPPAARGYISAASAARRDQPDLERGGRTVALALVRCPPISTHWRHRWASCSTTRVSSRMKRVRSVVDRGASSRS